MGGAVATHGNDEPIARGSGVVGGVTAAAGLDHLQVDTGTGAMGRTPLPETTSAAPAGRRVDDDEGPVP